MIVLYGWFLPIDKRKTDSCRQESVSFYKAVNW